MNRKIQITKRCIREALFECLKEKDINKITISSLCEKADINRSTFYKYYGSQYDVIKEMEQEVIQLINEQLNDQPKETSFIQLLQFLKSNKETIKIFFECNVDNEFPKQVLALDSINNQLEQVSQNDPYIKITSFLDLWQPFNNGLMQDVLNLVKKLRISSTVL
ncbi:MAG TPA: hypothetical protein DIV43_04890 [Erysipelotrichaceae bacterium]|nr:hypothetical protein [Erysipelotrichaceae bacterium]